MVNAAGGEFFNSSEESGFLLVVRKTKIPRCARDDTQCGDDTECGDDTYMCG